MRGALAAVLTAALALAGRPSPAAAQRPAAQPPGTMQEPVPGGRVDSIAIEGNHRISRANIVTAAGIPLKTPIGFRDIQRALHNLYDSGEFDSLSVLRTVGPDSAEILVIRLVERPLLQRVTVRGAGPAVRARGPRPDRDAAGAAARTRARWSGRASASTRCTRPRATTSPA